MLKPQSGSKRARKYWQQVRSNPKACPGGDCLCDMHEGVTAYRHSRVFRNKDLPGLLVVEEFEYYDYDDDYDDENSIQDWVDWLRTKLFHPSLGNTVLRAYVDN